MALEFVGDLTGNLGSAFGSLGTIMMYILGGLAFGLAAYAVWVFTSYNVEVTIHQHGQSAAIRRKYKGRFYINKENEKEYFVIRGKKHLWNQPLDKGYVGFVQAGKSVKRSIDFLEDREGRLQPIRPVMVDDIVRWDGWRNSDMEFAISHARRLIEIAKKGDFWSKYGTLIQMGFMALIVVMLIVLFRQLDGVVGGLESVASSLEGFKVISVGNETQVFS